MATFSYDIDTLHQLGSTAATLQYRMDAADELSLSVIPSAYGESFPWQPLDRVELFAPVEGARRCVFSGVVPMRGGVTLSGGSAPSMQLRACSDYYLLEHTAYAKVDAATGTPMAERDPELVQVDAFARKIFNWASGWSGSAIVSAFAVDDTLGTVPAPVSNGTTGCAAMLKQTLQWQPNAGIFQRYDATNGHTLHLGKPSAAALLTLRREEGLTNVTVTPRTDLVPPVCALVGAVHAVWPTGADVREPGAFVYAVPHADDTAADAAGAGSGGSPKGQKMQVRGYRIPADFHLLQEGESYSFTYTSPTAEQKRLLRRFFPRLAPILEHLLVSQGYVLPLEAQHAFPPDTDESGVEPPTSIPANYDTRLSQWVTTGRFIHTSGSFPAAADSRKNVSGLRWCKAQVLMGVALPESAYAALSASQKQEADRLLPGTRAKTQNSTATDELPLRRWATLQLSCNLINRSRKAYSTADNKLLPTDPDFSATEVAAEQSARAAAYRAAMAEYYAATRTVWCEGSLGLHFDGSRNPAALTGCLLHVAGLSPAWEQMHAIVRSVSWDIPARTISLQFGTREVLGFSERVERRNMARNASAHPQRAASLGADSLDPAAAADDESAMTIAADISTNINAGTHGSPRKPFSLYCDNGSYYYTGGIFTALGQIITVPHTQFTIHHGSPTSTPLIDAPVYLTCVRVNGTITFNLTQTT